MHRSRELLIISRRGRLLYASRMGKADDQRTNLPRWVVIYAMVLLLCLLVYVILDVIHGGPPWNGRW